MRSRNITNQFISLTLSLSLLLALPAQSPAVTAQPLADANSRPREPRAGSWRTYVLTSPAETPLPPPPHLFSRQTRAELAELRWLQWQRTPEIQARIDFWDALPAFKPWTEMQLNLIRSQSVNPPRAHRGLALVHVAIYDAIIAAWYWKYAYRRPRPDQLDYSLSPSVTPPLHPTYPSEHAAIAGAAARMLGYLFPADAAKLKASAKEAALSRLQAGVNYRSVRATPRDPSYTSGNSTCGGAVGEILAFFFPRDAESLRAEAEGGGISRLYDGTHWSFDIEAGLAIGRRMS